MAVYIHLFDTVAEYEETRANNYVEPWVSYTEETSGISFNKTEYEKLLGTPLTFNIISSGTIYWKTQNTAYTTTIEYSKDNGENWTGITSTTGGTSFNVNAGDKVMFRGDNVAYGSDGVDRNNHFSGSTAVFEAEGNIMSLINSTGFATETTLSSAYTFYYLFNSCTGLTSAEKLILPATTLANYCYQQMFAGNISFSAEVNPVQLLNK